MITKIKNFFSKEKWGLVKTFEQSISYNSRKGIIYFHLFESDKNNRKVELTTTMYVDKYDPSLEIFAKQLEIYNTRIYRWKMGRNDPDIPRYSEIKDEDLINALKGKID